MFTGITSNAPNWIQQKNHAFSLNTRLLLIRHSLVYRRHDEEPFKPNENGSKIIVTLPIHSFYSDTFHLSWYHFCIYGKGKGSKGMAESKLHRFAGSRNVISNSFVFGYNKIGVMVYIRICHVADDFILGEISSCRYIRQGGTLIKCISIKRQRSFGRPHLVACGKPVVTALGDLLIMIQGRNSRTFGVNGTHAEIPYLSGIIECATGLCTGEGN